MKKGDRVLVLELHDYQGAIDLWDGLFLPFGVWRGYVEFRNADGYERKRGPFPLEQFMPYSKEAAERLSSLLARNAECVKNLNQSNAEVREAFKALLHISNRKVSDA